MKHLLLIGLGCYMGFVCGLGFSFGKIEKLAERRPVINGNVTVIKNKKEPVSFANVDINATGCNYGVQIKEVRR